MRKKATPERIAKYLRDCSRMIGRYGKDEVARKLNMSNLGSYMSGNKEPGEMVINKFYTVFGEEISKDGYEFLNDDEQLSKVNEAKVAQLQDEWSLMDELKANTRFLRSNFEKIVETNQRLAKSNETISESNLILAKTNEKLANKS